MRTARAAYIAILDRIEAADYDVLAARTRFSLRDIGRIAVAARTRA